MRKHNYVVEISRTIDWLTAQLTLEAAMKIKKDYSADGFKFRIFKLVEVKP